MATKLELVNLLLYVQQATREIREDGGQPDEGLSRLIARDYNTLLASNKISGDVSTSKDTSLLLRARNNVRKMKEAHHNTRSPAHGKASR